MKVRTDHRKAKQREYSAKYRDLNADKVREYDAAYRKANRKRIRSKQRKDRDENRDKWQERWRKEPRTERRREFERRYRKKRQGIPKERLARALRGRIRDALAGKFRAGSAVRDLGCTLEELVAHIEAQWTEGMSWETYGQRGWHIDHIKPLASFDLTNRDQFLEAANYTNLQPLWAIDNLKKGHKTNDYTKSEARPPEYEWSNLFDMPILVSRWNANAGRSPQQ